MVDQRKRYFASSFLLILCVFVVLKLIADGDSYYSRGEFSPIRDDLYENEGVLAFETKHFSVVDGKQLEERIFITRFSFPDDDKKDLDPLLSDVVDKESWRAVAGLFYRDDHNLYCFTPSTNGGYLDLIENVNPDRLRFLAGNQWLEASKQSLKSGYSTDGELVFYHCDQLEGADVESFEEVFDENVEWFAQDKNKKYIGDQMIR